MSESGDERFVETLHPTIESMVSEGLSPYLIALELVNLSTLVIAVAYPNEEFRGFGRYLSNVSDNIEQCAQTKEDVIQHLRQMPPPDLEDLA